MCRAGTHPDPSSVVTITKGRPGGVLAPNLDTLADGYPDRSPDRVSSWAFTARTVVISPVSPFIAIGSRQRAGPEAGDDAVPANG